jgi:hypothetical protein
MRLNGNSAKVLMLAAALILMSGTLSLASSNDYKFKVHNNTKQDIKKLQVSEDGKKWGFFEIGDGIKAGETVELAWDKATDNEGCEQYFKVQFADNDWSEPVKFDFCEKGLVLEFN